MALGFKDVMPKVLREYVKAKLKDDLKLITREELIRTRVLLEALDECGMRVRLEFEDGEMLRLVKSALALSKQSGWEKPHQEQEEEGVIEKGTPR